MVSSKSNEGIKSQLNSLAVSILLVNAIAILSEDRFLARSTYEALAE